MSRVNYAKFRNNQKKFDLANEVSNQSHPNNQQQNSSPLQHQGSSPSDLGEQTPYPGTSNDKTEAARVLNLFGDNVVTDNLDYINNLLKSQFPDNVGPKNQQRKKRQNRQESKEPSSAQTTEDVTSPTQMSNALSPPVNSPNIFPEKGQNSDPNSSFMSPIEPVNNGKIEIQIASGILESADLVIKGREARKMSEIVGKQEIETVGDFYKGEIPDVGKRSMSMEDVKVVTRDFAKRNEKTKNVNILTDVDTRVERSYGQGQLDRSSKSINQDGNINNSDAKTEFSATLGHFIDYFQRSDTQQYRTIKASQYFHNGSHKGNSQRSGPSLNMENDALKHQVLKLRAKVEELMLMNELLTKERKLLKQKEEDLQYRAESAEAELATSKKKSKMYKEKLKSTQELLQREKLENESNLLALRRVLSNNINTVLEHKIQTYMSPAKEKSYRDKNINATAPDLEHVDKKKLARDKEKRKNFSTQANTFFNNKTLESMGNMADYSSLKKSKNNNLREKMSPLLSQKEPSFSDETDIKDIRDKLRMSQMEDFGDDIEEEYLVKNRKTSQYSIPHSDFETSSEPFEDFRLGTNGNKYETAKKIQQIKNLQDQLTKLIEQDDISPLNDNSIFVKPTSQRNNTNGGSRVRKPKGHTYSCYEPPVKEYQDSFSTMTNLTSKYEQHAKLYRQGLEDASRNFEFLNNPSFTVPNGESGYWKTNLARYRR